MTRQTGQKWAFGGNEGEAVRGVGHARGGRWGGALVALALLGAALTSCGTIPTPPVSLPDVTLDLQPSAASMGRVIYLRQDAFAGSSIPSALQQVSVTGTARYEAAAGTLRQIGVYVRPSLDTLPNTCEALAPGVLACEPSGEEAQAIGTVNLTPGQDTALTLRGAALDGAARAGHGYFGLRAIQGDSLAGERLRFTGLRAQAKF